MAQSRLYRARRSGEKLRRRAIIAAGLLVVLVVAWIGFAVLRSLPTPRLSLDIPTTSTIHGAPLVLRPPLGVQEAVVIGGIGTIAIAGDETPTPIASLTKIMSALVVLRDHPLSFGQSGPNISVTNADVATYRLERSEDDSVVAVRSGEQLSELQALEGALVPSGDNVIELLATWDAGSTVAFVGKMNALARRLGLHQTHYTGPSGVNPTSVSTAADQLRLAETAVANPVFADIVDMAQVNLPIAGVQYNVDADLGRHGINGIKTGWVPQSGGCFVFSAEYNANGTDVSVIGAVLGEQGATPVPTALSAAKQLVVASEKTLRTFHLPAGAAVATLSAPYASPVRVASTSPISLVDWSGAHLQFTARAARSLSHASPPGSPVGSLTIKLDQSRKVTELRTTAQLQSPSLGWRLTHL